jgi:hypothetical protein
VVPVLANGLTVSADGRVFTLEMQNVPVIDQPRWPALDSVATPARMTFKMVWKSNGEPVLYEDASKHEVPSIGFSLESDPLETSKCDFAIVGEEVNGRYYDMK